MFGRSELIVPVCQGDCITHDGKLEHGERLYSSHGLTLRCGHIVGFQCSGSISALVGMQAQQRSRAVSGLFSSGLSKLQLAARSVRVARRPLLMGSWLPALRLSHYMVLLGCSVAANSPIRLSQDFVECERLAEESRSVEYQKRSELTRSQNDRVLQWLTASAQ